MLLPARLAVTDPSLLTNGRSVSSVVVASIFRRRKISVTKLLRLAARPTAPGCPAAPSTGWMRYAPPAVGTATSPFARSVDRNTSKYSDRESGRSVTTDTFPCTRLSMMKVRCVTRAASWMKARMSASRMLSVCCAASGAVSASAAARVSVLSFIGLA